MFTPHSIFFPLNSVCGHDDDVKTLIGMIVLKKMYNALVNDKYMLKYISGSLSIVVNEN